MPCMRLGTEKGSEKKDLEKSFALFQTFLGAVKLVLVFYLCKGYFLAAPVAFFHVLIYP